MKKLFLFNILACLFALQGLALEVGQTFTYKDENGTWKCSTNNSAHYTVTIISASDYGKEVVIPGVVNDGENEYEVTQLGRELFCNSIISKVTLPKSLRSLGAKAFYGCSDLQSVDLSFCEWIGQSAFSQCPKLRASLGWLCPILGSDAFDTTATLIAPFSGAASYRYSPDWFYDDLKSASNLNDNLNCSKELEHYAS